MPQHRFNKNVKKMTLCGSFSIFNVAIMLVVFNVILISTWIFTNHNVDLADDVGAHATLSNNRASIGLAMIDDIEGEVENSQKVAIESLKSKCDEYTMIHTENRNISCRQALLAHSGVDYLRQFLPNTNEKEGYASLRILDSYAFTSTKVGGCRYAQVGDGRHFPPLDLLQLRVIAEGVLKTIGSSSLTTLNSENYTKIFKEYSISLPQQSTASTAASSEDKKTQSKERKGPDLRDHVDKQYDRSFGGGGKDDMYLISRKHTKILANTLDIGSDLHSLFKLAFGNRHIGFIGDSTTRLMFSILTSYLTTMEGVNAPSDARARQSLTTPTKAIHQKDKEGNNSTTTTTTATGADFLSFRNSTSSESKQSFAANNNRKKLTSPEAHHILGLGCNNVTQGMFEAPSSPHFGGRCSYRFKKCLVSRGCVTPVEIKTMNLKLSSSDGGGALRYHDPDFALSKLKEFEEHSFEEKNTMINTVVSKSKYFHAPSPSFSSSSSSSSSFDLSDGKRRDQRREMFREVDVVVITGGLHYLHLYPVRKYSQPGSGADSNFGLVLGNYEEEMNKSLDALRKYLGPDKLVIWKTVNEVCDHKYEGAYKRALLDLTHAGVFA